ncbi:MAG: DUF2721 domain-containing protein [Opitutales bacterium]
MDLPASTSPLSIIQLSITPVILLSGVGGLMITLTNRMGRIVDRTRSLAGLLRQAPETERGHLEQQLDILWRRAGLIRLAVTCAGSCMLVACLLIVVIFAGATWQRQLTQFMTGLFGLSVGLLIASLGTFRRDIYLSLHALRLEVDKARGRPA